MFDRFRQGDASSTRSYSGLGLGLAIVQHLVEAHGGTVAGTSEGPGHGAEFTICLPVVSRRRETDGANLQGPLAARWKDRRDARTQAPMPGGRRAMDVAPPPHT
jgi:hypothetical protein